MLRSTLSLTVGAALLLLPDTMAAQAQPDPAMIAKGAQLYGVICSRCHNPRGATERTDDEWGLIVLHMRSRANMSRSAAAAVLAFLQATNLPEGGPTVATRPPRAPEPLADRRMSGRQNSVTPDADLARLRELALWLYIRAHSSPR